MTREAPWRADLGAEVLPDGVRFRVWAPRPRSVAVRVVAPREALVPMKRGADGTWEAIASGIGAGADYFFVLDGDRARPDPRSRWQPRGVHGPSRVVDPSLFRWTDGAYCAPALADLVIYELHTGTFTPEGTFDAIVPRLEALHDLGIRAVELMPVAEFPGARNWGYDGVGLFAPSSAYGGPRALRRLVDACHAEGIAVILDVVYNHLGPEGNYLAELGPYFTDRYRTPWGQAVNYDDAGSDAVRAFVIDNAVSWLAEYHVDGLRLDAVHGIFDQSALHILEEIGAAFHAEAARRGRTGLVIAESDLNDPRLVRPVEAGGFGLDACWSDDFHHALHAVLTGDRRGYFADFGRVADLAGAIENGFVYDGRYSVYRGRRHGRAAAGVPRRRFVVCSQNHDQIANGSGGDRQAARVPAEEQELAAVLLLLSPGVPLLFMGQEYGETSPFHYFTSHGDEALARAVTKGRREELRSFGRDDFRDPQDPATFEASKLARWGADTSPHAELRELYRELLRLRREHPSLGADGAVARIEYGESSRWIAFERACPGAAGAFVVVNFEAGPVQVPALPSAGPRWALALRAGGGPAAAPRPPESLEMNPGAPGRLSVPGRTAFVYIQCDAPEGAGR